MLLVLPGLYWLTCPRRVAAVDSMHWIPGGILAPVYVRGADRQGTHAVEILLVSRDSIGHRLTVVLGVLVMPRRQIL